MTGAIAHDLSRKMQQDLAAVLERNGNIARHALEPAGIAIILIEAAVMMTRTAAATIANMSNDDADVAQLFDTTVAAIVEHIQNSRENGLSRTMAARAAQRS